MLPTTSVSLTDRHANDYLIFYKKVVALRKSTGLSVSTILRDYVDPPMDRSSMFRTVYIGRLGVVAPDKLKMLANPVSFTFLTGGRFAAGMGRINNSPRITVALRIIITNS